MYLVQKTTSAPSADSKMAQSQASMGMFMTVFFTWMMWVWKFPSALMLYWLVFNIFSIIQQIIIMNEQPKKPVATPVVTQG